MNVVPYLGNWANRTRAVDILTPDKIDISFEGNIF